MAAGKRIRRQVGAVMLSSVVALGVSVISSTAKSEDDASRFTYVRLHCTPDNQSHFFSTSLSHHRLLRLSNHCSLTCMPQWKSCQS
jgi:hypothetical protein